MGDMETKKRETMIEFKKGDKVRVVRRGTTMPGVGKVLAVIQGRHAGTLLVDIPRHNQTWGHYKPSELRLIDVNMFDRIVD